MLLEKLVFIAFIRFGNIVMIPNYAKLVEEKYA